MKLSEDVATDLFHLMCGPEIGSGQYRTVFEHQFDKSVVIKHDNRRNWSNVNEFQIWQEFQGTPIGEWLAPCAWLSAAGFWLIQARTKPIAAGRFPKRIPAIFCDIKPSNWGMYKGRPVCHDYGNHAVFELARRQPKAMQSVVWEHRVS